MKARWELKPAKAAKVRGHRELGRRWVCECGMVNWLRDECCLICGEWVGEAWEEEDRWAETGRWVEGGRWRRGKRLLVAEVWDGVPVQGRRDRRDWEARWEEQKEAKNAKGEGGK